MPQKKFYTVIIVPHAKAKFRKVKVPYNVLLGAGVLALGLVVALGFLSLRFITLHGQGAELVRLGQENFRLKRENTQTREVTDALREQLDGFQETVSQFKMMFGVESQASSGVGEIGSGAGVPPEDPNRRYHAFSYLSQLKSEADVLQAELDLLRESIGERHIVLDHTPSLRPVKNGFVSSGFGMRRDPFTGKRVFHGAVDISTWHWDEIFAPADGIVTRTDRSRGSGLFVEVSHGYGYTTLFAHLKSVNVAPGQKVRRHQVIGYVGSSGRSTGPHLHYEIRYQGKRVDPSKFMVDSPQDL